MGKKDSETDAKDEAEDGTRDGDDDEAEAEGAEEDEDEASKGDVGSRLAGSPGAIIPKVSPAPSQSELVSNGVWTWIKSFSYNRSATLRRILVVPPLRYATRTAIREERG